MASKTPYGLQIIENCLGCPLHQDRIFCDLRPDGMARLSAISSPNIYPKGAILFVEGQEPRGIFVVCHGRVKLSASSVSGKTIILRVAEKGEVVGLPGTISGKPYEATAEAIEPVQVNFIPRKPFLDFLRNNGEVALRVAETLTDIYFATYREVRCLGLTRSVEEKLASFLLDFAEANASNESRTRATLTLTHEEIAGMLGVTRETVTRLFSDFRRRNLIQLRGSSLVIANKTELQKLLQA